MMPRKNMGPPPWAQSLLNSMQDVKQRIAVLEAREVPHQTMPMLHEHAVAGQVETVTTSRTCRCDLCGEPFVTATWKMGDAFLCAECKRPGAKPRKCECGKTFAALTDETICKRCQKCVLCGTKEHDEVCAKCIKAGTRICDGCLRLATQGSAFCAKCDLAFRNKNAGHFVDTPNPGVSARALDEHQQAVMAAAERGDGEAYQRLTMEPDLQPALPSR